GAHQRHRRRRTHVPQRRRPRSARPRALRGAQPAGADRQGPPVASCAHRARGLADHRPYLPLPDGGRHRPGAPAGGQLAVRPPQRREGSRGAVHGLLDPSSL
ncbi:MAG: hypothetical protein AVDCRST_MAG65-915, partial [uncultured Solirubrobacteraceae bacterium]